MTYIFFSFIKCFSSKKPKKKNCVDLIVSPNLFKAISAFKEVHPKPSQTTTATTCTMLIEKLAKTGCWHLPTRNLANDYLHLFESTSPGQLSSINCYCYLLRRSSTTCGVLRPTTSFFSYFRTLLGLTLLLETVKSESAYFGNFSTCLCENYFRWTHI